MYSNGYVKRLIDKDLSPWELGKIDGNGLSYLSRKGNTSAMNMLGSSFYAGQLHTKCFPRDYEKAESYFRVASENGNKKARANLLHLYVVHKGRHNSIQKADKVYRDIQDSRAVENLKDSFEWLKKAAELGNAEAQYSLGYMYRDGEGVDKDLKESNKWFKKSMQINMAA